MKDKRITRLLRLLQMLQSGPGKNASGLAKACGVGRRTIFRDLQTLRDAGVPFEFDAKAHRYCVQQSSLIPPAQFTADEALALVALATEFGRNQGLPFYDAADNAALKLERSLPRRCSKECGASHERSRFGPPGPAFSLGRPTFTNNWSPPSRSGVSCKSNTKASPNGRSITTKLRPYQLLFCQHSWYVFGRSSLHREVRIFNLARIESMEMLKERFVVPRTFDLDRHLGNAWHLVPASGRDCHVAVRFKSLVARNVAEVNWHKTQRTKFLPDGSMVFRATVSGLSEIAWWILGYGDQAEVLQPERLRQLIAQRARNMAAMYDGI